MLVLGRKEGEQIVLPDCGVTVTVIAIAGNQVRLGISAPPEVAIHREEIWQKISKAAGASLRR
jgi:carbon storage regulator